jgi:hypothetical protein
MIFHQIVNVEPTLVEGRLFALKFTVLAIDGDMREDAHCHTPCTLPEREEPYTQSDYMDKAGEIAAAQSVYTTLNAKLEARKAELLPPVEVPMATLPEAQRRAAWVKQVDDLIGEIIGRAMRFQMGYVEREAEAKRYKATSYAGVPNDWIKRFADNIKIPYRMATDIILGQAAQLRKANKELEDLRMDKYLISNAKTIELAEAQFNRIVAAANVIGKTI